MFREDDKKSLLIGVGLAFSLGWLWFPWLGALWLPGVVWGSADSGGGAAFLLILVFGFLFGGIFAERLSVPREDESPPLPFLRAHCRRLCHCAAYLLLVTALLLRLYGPIVLPASWPYLALPAAAVAYVFCGLYWAAKLVALPHAAAPAAFFCAVFSAILIGQATAFLPPEIQLSLWPQGIPVAWIMAEMLERRERAKTKIRGRPRKIKSEDEFPPFEICAENRGPATGRAAYGFGLAFALTAVSCAAGSTWSPVDAHRSPSTWATGLCFCLGASVPAFVVRLPTAPVRRELLANIAAVFFTFLAVLYPAFSMSRQVDFPALAEGAISGLGLAALAGRGLKSGAAARRAGMIVCVSVLALNGGWILGELAGSAAGLVTAGILALAAALPLLRRPVCRIWVNVGSRADGSAPCMDNNSAEPANAASFFTREEMQIICLLARQELSNQAIADALFISRATVRYHLRKMYIKTNTSSREELLQFVAAHHNETLESL